MEDLGALFLRVCTVSAGCSVVLALLLALLPRLRERIAARSLYVLFLVLALRLLLPVEVRLPAPAVTVPAPDYTLSMPVPRPEPNVGQVQPVLAPVESPQPAPARKIPVLHILALVWVLGAAACVLCSAGGFLLARRKLLKGSVPADVDLEDLRRELGVGRPVRLVYSAAAPCPLALGLLRPIIVLPAGQSQVDELVLRHELTHIRRWDVAYKLVLSLACWLNWFNPLVWLMDRAAGRNLELCCDDEVTRDLSDAERRRYGNLLLDAAAAKAIPFSTCFSGGKTQMKERLVNLFTHKRNSAALVGLVLIAALLAGGLVACEKADASAPTGGQNAEPMGASSGPTGGGIFSAPTIMPQDQANRELLEMYFYENFHEDECSVVLADLTGDGLEEMLVITMDPFGEEPFPMRKGVTVQQFTLARESYYTVQDGIVTAFPGTSDVSSSHAGWGYDYLVPNPTGEGYALLDFRPYTGQGMASYSYGVFTLNMEEGFTTLEQGTVDFHVLDADADYPNITGEELWEDSSIEEVEQLLARVQAYRDSGVSLLVYNTAYGGTTSGPEFAYLDAAPADVFSGKIEMTVPGLREHVISSGEPVHLALPSPGPASPEEALDSLEANILVYEGGVVFRIPLYDGEWNIHVAGRMRMGGEESDNYMSVHYLEGEEWTPGKRYSFETAEGAYYNDLYLFVTVTAPDGTQAERTIVLSGPQNEVDSDLPDGGEN